MSINKIIEPSGKYPFEILDETVRLALKDISDRVSSDPDVVEEMKQLTRFTESLSELKDIWRESEILRGFTLNHTPHPGKGKRGTTLPRFFRIPLLEVLNNFGWPVEPKDALKALFKKMERTLTPQDMEKFPGRTIPAWKESVSAVRYRMTNEGLVSIDNPTKAWEITEKGIKYLSDNRSEKEPVEGPF